MTDTDDNSCDFANISEAETLPAPEPERWAVLPPEHPLLQKFQAALKEHLLNSKSKIENIVDELKYEIKAKEQCREEQGLALYDLQQKLAFQEEQIKEISVHVDEHIEKREKEEATVAALKKEYDEKIKFTSAQKSLYHKRMAELEDLQSLGSNIKKWAYDVEDEVKNAQRIVSRDAQLQKQLSEEKRKSDILFFRLESEVKKREAELKSICEEETAMQEVLNIINMSISDANTDLEALQSEHKRLTQAWSEVIIAIQLRDKILFQVQDNIRKQKESIKLSTGGIEAIKKQMIKEVQLNRKLEAFKQHLAADTNMLRLECQRQAETLGLLQAKLDELPELLARTEEDMHEASKEGTKLMSEIRRLGFTLDKQRQKKFQLEEDILKLAQEQLMTNKASTYRLKLLNKAQGSRRLIDLSLSKVQNQLATAMLDVEKLRSVLFKMREESSKGTKELEAVESKSDALDADLKNMHSKIEVKMKRLEQLNNKIEKYTSQSGEANCNPTELKIKQLEKIIHTGEQQMRGHQQFWIMLQNHLVNISQKRNNQLNEIQVTRKQLSIIKQKNLKIELDLEVAENRTKELKMDVKQFTTKLELLNDKIYKKRQHSDEVEIEFEREQLDLSQKLKDNEHAILKLEEAINDLQVEIELNKDLVLDNHREALSWETKYKLIEETIHWSKTERSLNGEIGAMKIEIHRMEIRHNQLKRAQEKLVQDMQQGVMHREQILVNATLKQETAAKVLKLQSASQAHVKLQDLHSKSKLVATEIAYLSQKRLEDDRSSIEKLIFIINKTKTDLKLLSAENAEVQARMEECVLKKHANLEQLIRKQNRAKVCRRLLKSKMQQKMVRPEAIIQQQMEKQSETNDTLMEIVQTLITDYPEKKSFFTKVIQVLKE